MLLGNNEIKKQAENEKQTLLERLYWVVFQFFIQKYHSWQNNTFWNCPRTLSDAALLLQKKRDAGGLRWTKYLITKAFEEK